jgi:flagellar motor switch protein FliN/FliY
MSDQRKHQAARAFAGAFAVSLGEVLKQKSLQSWEIEVPEGSSTKNLKEKEVHIRLSANGSLRGECFVALPQSQILQLALILGQTGSEFTEDHGKAFSELIADAIEGLCSTLLPQYGSLTFKADRVQGLVLEGMFSVPLAASEQGKSAIEIRLYFDGDLLGALASSQGDTSPAEQGKTLVDPANLKLVMDVELNVSLRFGQCQLPLREVLDLASGSVIELDRDVDDPVELLLDGKIIARGEAVIIDGNYGLRVTEIPQPMASHFIR